MCTNCNNTLSLLDKSIGIQQELSDRNFALRQENARLKEEMYEIVEWCRKEIEVLKTNI